MCMLFAALCVNLDIFFSANIPAVNRNKLDRINDTLKLIMFFRERFVEFPVLE